MDKRLKLVVVGDSYVGKTSLLFAYTEKKFLGNYQTTIFDNYAVTLTVDQKRCTVNLFDTAGQEDYAHLRVLSYPQTDVFLLCFSLVDPPSLEACQTTWMPEIRKYAGSETPVVLVGTKEDLYESTKPQDRVDWKTAQRLADEMGCAKFLACSSLTHRGLKRVFDEGILLAIGSGVEEKPRNRSICCIPL
ncbi:Protein CRP-1 [Aphelenchoides avenae]|nr:Protein CRP-1 [Aphelenchus avenae]